MQKQNKPFTCHCQMVFMVEIIIDIALVIVSIAAIVIIVKRWRGKNDN